jgi:jasmonate ZIM domain-containing protein
VDEGERERERRKGAAGAMAGHAPARDKTTTGFAATCSLLSQFLKEKKGGLQGLGGLAMAPAPAAGKATLALPCNLLGCSSQFSHPCTVN